MSADRRTLAIAAVAMVALVLVGVVSAAIFTQSACDALAPDHVEPRAAGGDVEEVLAEALDDLDASARSQLLGGLQSVVGDGGSVVGAADVSGARQLADVGDRLAATGPVTTVLAGPGQGPVATAELSEDATVVGQGESLFAVALVNELTGQVDALAGLDADLAEQDCTDTATVGVPLAFHLDAEDGQLALFRVDEDADGPQLQLRDDDGPIWDVDVELGSGPPGILAERLTAALGDELLVTARRSLGDEEAPALTALARDDGAERWRVTPGELEDVAPGGASALVPRVVAVTPGGVVVSLTREEGSRATLLVGLDAEDGEVAWTSDLTSDGVPRSVGVLEDELVLLTDQGQLREVVLIDPDDGSGESLHASSGQRGTAAVVDGEVLLGTTQPSSGLARVRPSQEAETLSLPGEVIDVRAHDGLAAVLLRSEQGEAVVWLDLGEPADA